MSGSLPEKPRRAIIAGAGVGGLAAALALSRAGWDVQVLERAGAVEEVGAGIQISANGWRALLSLGVAEEVRHCGFAPLAAEMRDGVSGRRMVTVPLGPEGELRWGGNYLQLHRADLIGVLLRALEAQAPGAVRTGAKVSGYERRDKKADVLLEGGERLECELLIGADGVRSTIREAMLGPESPRFLKAVAWRGLVPAENVSAHPPRAIIWAGAGRHAVSYPLRNGGLINVVAITAEETWRGEGWSEPGDPARLQAAFEGWAPQISGLIRQVEAPFRWALFDRPPLPRWSDGPVTLLGDACHPMAPSFAQGACQALEDAVSLARRLEEADEVSPVLEAHFAARHERTARIQAESLANMRRFHAGRLANLAVGVAGRLAPGWFTRRLDWVYRSGI